MQLFVSSLLENIDKEENILILLCFTKFNSKLLEPHLFKITESFLNEADKKNKDSSKLIAIMKIFEQIVTVHEKIIYTEKREYFINIEEKLESLIYNEELGIIYQSIKLLSFIILNITKNFTRVKEIFLPILIFVESENFKLINEREPSPDQILIRSLYIMTILIKFFNFSELNPSSDSDENQNVEDIFEYLTFFLSNTENLEIEVTCFECLTYLWEKKPDLVFKCRKYIQKYIGLLFIFFILLFIIIVLYL